MSYGVRFRSYCENLITNMYEHVNEENLSAFFGGLFAASVSAFAYELILHFTFHFPGVNSLTSYLMYQTGIAVVGSGLILYVWNKYIRPDMTLPSYTPSLKEPLKTGLVSYESLQKDDYVNAFEFELEEGEYFTYSSNSKNYIVYCESLYDLPHASEEILGERKPEEVLKDKHLPSSKEAFTRVSLQDLRERTKRSSGKPIQTNNGVQS